MFPSELRWIGLYDEICVHQNICEVSQQNVLYVGHVYFEILSKKACKNSKKIVRNGHHLVFISYCCRSYNGNSYNENNSLMYIHLNCSSNMLLESLSVLANPIGEILSLLWYTFRYLLQKPHNFQE